MTKEQIKKITDKAKQPCLVGMVGFDEDIQQHTCRFFNGDKCSCYNDYKKALEDFIVGTRKQCPANLICNCGAGGDWDGVCKMYDYE